MYFTQYILRLSVFRPHRLYAVHDEAYCYIFCTQHGLCVCLCVLVSVLCTRVSCEKPAEPIEMPFGG